MSSEHRQTSDPGVPAEPSAPFYPAPPAGSPGFSNANGVGGLRNGHSSDPLAIDSTTELDTRPTVRFDSVDPITRRLSPDHPGFVGPGEELAPVERKSSAHSLIREVLETVILAVLIFLAVRAVVQNFKVEGSSMIPSFIDGEYMLVNKAIYSRIDLRTVHRFLPFVDAGQNPEKYVFHPPQHGDVIVFHPPLEVGGDKKDFIKRVIGVPGDTVEFRDTHVVVNGQTLIEPYIAAPTACQGQFCKVTLGANQFFVMGDNRTNSSDSRFWGPVSADKIIGKALVIYWCGGRDCKQGTDHIGLAPNHSPAVAVPTTPTP